VLNYHTTHEKRIREQPAVALPPQRLGAHYSCGGETSKRVERPNSLVELRRLHVVRVTPESGLTQSRVYGIGPGAAHSPKGWDMPVDDSCRLQRISEGHLAELGMPS
jgi:hypothetical protein